MSETTALGLCPAYLNRNPPENEDRFYVQGPFLFFPENITRNPRLN